MQSVGGFSDKMIGLVRDSELQPVDGVRREYLSDPPARLSRSRGKGRAVDDAVTLRALPAHQGLKHGVTVSSCVSCLVSLAFAGEV